MNLGAPELMLLLVVILVLFGSAKLPKLARSVGEAQREFRNGLKVPVADDSPGESPNQTPGEAT